MIIGQGGTGLSLLTSVSNPYRWMNYSCTYLPVGPQLKKMLERAWKGAKIQREVADSMTVTWSEFVPGWRKILAAYKKDSSNPNPFEEPDTGKDV